MSRYRASATSLGCSELCGVKNNRNLRSLDSSTIIRDIDAIRKSDVPRTSLVRVQVNTRNTYMGRYCHSCFNTPILTCTIVSDVSTRARGSQLSSNDTLVQCLENMLEYPGQTPMYVVVDALDECPNTISTPTRRDQVYNLQNQAKLHENRRHGPTYFRLATSLKRRRQER